MDHANERQARALKPVMDNPAGHEGDRSRQDGAPSGRDGTFSGQDGGAVGAEPAGSDVARISEYFRDRLARFGPELSACDYGSLDSQQTRFRVIREVMPLTGVRLLDVGCGLAHLADYLETMRDRVDYEGVDICPAMIEQATQRRPDLRLAALDVLGGGADRANHGVGAGAHDVVVANGIFYLLQADPVVTMQRIIRRLFDLATRCVVFTSLSTWAPRAEPGEFQADPLATLEFCRTLTPRVVLRHDYLPHDFAVYLYREAGEE